MATKRTYADVVRATIPRMVVFQRRERILPDNDRTDLSADGPMWYQKEDYSFVIVHAKGKTFSEVWKGHVKTLPLVDEYSTGF